MAVAETAELAVKLTLDDSKFTRALRGADTRLQGLGRTAKTVGKGVATGLGVVAVGGAVLFVDQLKKGMESLRELETVTTQTNAVIASTKGVAGESAESIRNLAEKYEGLNAIIDDKVIQSGANVLLTFTRIRKKAFEPALEASLNLATALDKDLQSSVILVGKALNDPIKGLTSLTRAGIQFTDQQKQQIKTLVEQNDLYGAQQIILAELTTQFGGSFAAAGDTAAGKQAKLADAIEDVQKAIASKLLPVVTKVTERLTQYLGKPETLAFFERLSTTIAGLLTDENLDAAASAMETAATAVGVAISAFNKLPPEIKALAIGAFAINKVTGGAVGGAAEAFGKLIGAGLKQIFAANVTVIGTNVTGGGGGGAPAAGGGAAGKVGGVIAGATGAGALFAAGTILNEISGSATRSMAEAFGKANTPIAAQLETMSQHTSPLTSMVTTLTNLDKIPGQLARVGDFLGGKTDGMGNRIVDATTALKMDTKAEAIATRNATQAGLAGVKQKQQDSLVAFRAGERATLTGNSLQRTANDRLAAIRAKKTQFSMRTFVNVNTRVSVSEFQRQARYTSRVARSTSLSAS